MHSNSVIIHRGKVLYVSNESLRIFPQYCILSLTTLHSRSVPLMNYLGLVKHGFSFYKKKNKDNRTSCLKPIRKYQFVDKQNIIITKKRVLP